MKKISVINLALKTAIFACLYNDINRNNKFNSNIDKKKLISLLDVRS